MQPQALKGHANPGFQGTEAQAAGLRLIALTPGEEHRDLRTQIVGRDAVHAFGQRSEEELLHYRIGEEGTNKRACVLTGPNGHPGSRQALAMLYTSGFSAPETMASYDALPGNAAAILHEPVAPAAAANGLVCYSITGLKKDREPLLKGAGRTLLEQLLEKCAETAEFRHIVTLSPLRGLDAWLAERNGHGTPEGEVLRRRALEYLLEKKDGVQRFHMGNGAAIGAIRLDANTPDSLDAILGRNVMVTYVYPLDPERRRHNRELFRAAVLHMPSLIENAILREEALSLQNGQNPAAPAPAF